MCVFILVRSSNAAENFFRDNANFSSASKSSDSSFLDYANFPPLAKNNDNTFSEQRQRWRPFPSSSPIKNFPQSQRLKENSPLLRGGEPSESANHITPNPTQEVFARKVFIGGLPMDISEGKNWPQYFHRNRHFTTNASNANCFLFQKPSVHLSISSVRVSSIGRINRRINPTVHRKVLE